MVSNRPESSTVQQVQQVQQAVVMSPVAGGATGGLYRDPVASSHRRGATAKPSKSKRRLPPWPPAGCDLPSLEALEALSHGEQRRQQELFPRAARPVTGRTDAATVGLARRGPGIGPDVDPGRESVVILPLCEARATKRPKGPKATALHRGAPKVLRRRRPASYVHWAGFPLYLSFPMTPENEILIRAWAATCALWRPMVLWDFKTPRNTYFARRRFRQRGIPWASGKADDSERQAASRALAGVDSGLLIVTRRGGRTCYVRLSEAGEVRAAALVGQPDLAANLAEMRRLAALDGDPAELVGFFQGGIAEDWLLGWVDKASGPKDKQEFLAGVGGLTDRLLLALVRGWVESNSSGDNRVYYRLTDSGRQALDNPPKSPSDCPSRRTKPKTCSQKLPKRPNMKSQRRRIGDRRASLAVALFPVHHRPAAGRSSNRDTRRVQSAASGQPVSTGIGNRARPASPVPRVIGDGLCGPVATPVYRVHCRCMMTDLGESVWGLTSRSRG